MKDKEVIWEILQHITNNLGTGSITFCTWESKQKKREEGSQLRSNVRNLDLNGKYANILDFYIQRIENLRSLETKRKLFNICSARGM